MWKTTRARECSRIEHFGVDAKEERSRVAHKQETREAHHRKEKHSKGRESGVAQKGKGTAEWHTVRRTRRHSKRGG